MTFTILGAPRTKKNHGRVIRRGKRRFHVPSEAQTNWAERAVVQLRSQACGFGTATIIRERKISGRLVKQARHVVAWGPVNCRALIYRDADRGDAVGYYQSIADALEAADVLENDRLIVSWDGSKLLIDRERPRVELELTPMEPT